jgi:hypothetical protein
LRGSLPMPGTSCNTLWCFIIHQRSGEAVPDTVRDYSGCRTSPPGPTAGRHVAPRLPSYLSANLQVGAWPNTQHQARAETSRPSAPANTHLQGWWRADHTRRNRVVCALGASEARALAIPSMTAGAAGIGLFMLRKQLVLCWYICIHSATQQAMLGRSKFAALSKRCPRKLVRSKFVLPRPCRGPSGCHTGTINGNVLT